MTGRAIEVLCDGCGVEATVLKFIVCRADRECQGVLCDSRYEPLAERLWIIPGMVPCFGTCRRCGEWVSVNDLRDKKPGYPVSGVCVDCAEEG